jgi:hypothetical protein
MLCWLLDRCASGVDWPAQLRSSLGQKKGKKREGRKKRLFAIFSKEDKLMNSNSNLNSTNQTNVPSWMQQRTMIH